MIARQKIFAELRSFDHLGLTDEEFEAHALSLLSPQYSDKDAFFEAFLARTPIEPFEPAGEYDAAEAEEVLRNIFTFYGEKHPKGKAVAWNENPGTDHWIHDLNRFTYVRLLATAYLDSEDERFGRKTAELILDWVAKNEVCDAPEYHPEDDYHNRPYGSYLNVAIHLTRWTDVIDIAAPFLEPIDLLRVIKSMYDQLRWLQKVIPKMTNNWIVIGATGMMETAVRMPELAERTDFIEYAWDKLATEAERQVLDDGVQFELAQCYHMCVLERLTRPAELCRKAGLEVPDVIDTAVPPMIDYVMQTVTPDGSAVAFNDSDADSGLRFRNYLAKQGRIYGRDDWLYVGTGGKEGVEPSILSQPFENGGIYVMRTGWDEEAVYVAFDGGPWGYSHQHDDKLSFWLSAYGRKLIVDPGRYLYDANNPYTPYLRTSHAHSTITVDNLTQADRNFHDLRVPDKRLEQNTWVHKGDFQQVVSQHELGYGTDEVLDAVHRRGLLFYHPDLVLVVDRVTGKGKHAVESRFQMAPTDVVENKGLWHTSFGDADLAIRPWVSAEFSADIEKGMTEPYVSGWYSDGVNKLEPSPTMVIRSQAKLPVTACTVLVPYRDGAVPAIDLDVTDGIINLTVNDRKLKVSFEKALAR